MERMERRGDGGRDARGLSGGWAVAKVIESRPASFRTVLSRIIITAARSFTFVLFEKRGKVICSLQRRGAN